MVIHDALADGRFALRHTGAARRDHAAGLVACDERLGAATEAERCLCSAGRRAVELEIASAHARSLHLEHHLARSWRTIGGIAYFDLSNSEIDRTTLSSP